MSLAFFFGAMNSGKTTLLLQTAHSYRARGLKVIVVAHKDNTRETEVSSRLGVSYPADLVLDASTNLKRELEVLSLAEPTVKLVLVDEAQFLTPRQVEELLEFTILHGIDAYCYGLKTNFRTKAFPGAMRLLELADRLEDLKLTRCRCGGEACFNTRFNTVTHTIEVEGPEVLIEGASKNIIYDPLCAECFLKYGGSLSQSFNPEEEAL